MENLRNSAKKKWLQLLKWYIAAGCITTSLLINFYYQLHPIAILMLMTIPTFLAGMYILVGDPIIKAMSKKSRYISSFREYKDLYEEYVGIIYFTNGEEEVVKEPVIEKLWEIWLINSNGKTKVGKSTKFNFKRPIDLSRIREEYKLIRHQLEQQEARECRKSALWEYQ